MTSNTAAPRRACRLVLDLEGDDRDAIIRALENIILSIDREEMNSGASGGYDSGYTYTYTESDRPTHDEYVADLSAYLKRNKT